MGIIQGLQCAWELGVRKAVLQTDSKAAVELISSASSLHPHYQLVLQVRRLRERQWETEIEHVFREGNVAADFLASTGHSLPLGVHLISIPSPLLNFWLLYDLEGNQSPRLISSG
ncbi:unnamed protein product [Linum tenue]|nr:unnamed protein product [Linum tenue]